MAGWQSGRLMRPHVRHAKGDSRVAQIKGLASVKTLHQIVGARDPQPYDGKPFYCTVCGAGWGEYMACERPECELESAWESRQRQVRHQRELNKLKA
jgi:hypothetical protein